ncbi:alpha carbonic anhydrase 7-like [Cucurbita pepo subsp. pepo]|uniref:alpha carbonic anhydrase 7-like n=1 Tax=Cucurbita pepo subsp. pepo TaxID=3664 RepID=UPI000C9D6152|nr:alpha carbonic anhydrase 7-like [Cucurbita pepo subsp. pepo]XP_023519287.1 alpha carbonic anhydrase 7-like [Cucurbita pepo subsp. pepo]
MEKLSFHALFCTFLCAFLLVSWRAMSQEVEDQKEFDYNEEGKRGPSHWGDLKREWHSCKAGLMQSPIDLLHERVRIVPHFTNLKTEYKPSNATLKNRGHDIMLKWGEGAGYMEVNGTRYFLKQFHWHSPSEHTINGRRFALEAHLVHQSPTGSVAVIGVLYKIGRPDYFLSKMKEYLEEVSDTKEDEPIDLADPSQLEMRSSLYYRYIGSLTVPPCSQNVLWTLVRKVRTVSPEQVKLLRVAVHDDSDTNARPLQPLNDRKIQLRVKS